MMVLNAHLPHQYRGIAMAGFLAAFMSTIATQLNWGASYLVADFYRRFLRRNASERHYVSVSRVCTVLLVIASAWVSVHLASIASGWEVVLQIGAGTGAVYILRWYWWRINAWSEISAMACSLLVTLVLTRWQPFSGNESLVFAKSALTTTLDHDGGLAGGNVSDQALSRTKFCSASIGWCGRMCAAGSASPRWRPRCGSTGTSGRNLGAWALGCVDGLHLPLRDRQAAAAANRHGQHYCCSIAVIVRGLLYRVVIRNFKMEPDDEDTRVPRGMTV